MFGKKNKANEDTFLDKEIRTCVVNLLEFNQILTAKVEKVIIANGVINLYPEGSADRQKAVADAAKAKSSMMNTLANYDNLHATLRRLLATDGERNTTIYWTINRWCESHEIVENAYRNFFRK